MIRDMAKRVSAGRGQTVMLTGEPGIGKSRFCDELVQQLAAEDWLCLTTRAAPYASGEPWLAVRRILRSYFEAVDGSSAEETVREKICGRDPALHGAIPALMEIMGLPVSDPAWRALKPAERRQRIFDAFSGWLGAESCQRPVLIVVDDLQWIDAETETLLHSVSGLTGSAPILLMLVARSDYAVRQAGFGSAAQIRLQPLTAVESAKLLEELVGPSSDLAGVKARLIERAGGNPLYLEEIIRVLNDKTAHIAEMLPPSVQAIIAARIDALPGDEKTLLQAAAVLGQEFDLTHLADSLAQDEDNVRTALFRLQSKAFCRNGRSFPRSPSASINLSFSRWHTGACLRRDDAHCICCCPDWSGQDSTR
jgi:predicted ATPase